MHPFDVLHPHVRAIANERKVVASDIYKRVLPFETCTELRRQAVLFHCFFKSQPVRNVLAAPMSTT